MNAFEYQIFFVANIISNLLAILILIAAWKWKTSARLAFLLIFGVACWVNWHTVLKTPEAYLNFAQVAVLPWYQEFIKGWFWEHSRLVVGFIATSQGLIAISMLLNGWVYKTGIIGGTFFLLAVTPLGFGSAFPCTLILAFALMLLWREDFNLIQTESTMMHHG